VQDEVLLLAGGWLQKRPQMLLLVLLLLGACWLGSGCSGWCGGGCARLAAARGAGGGSACGEVVVDAAPGPASQACMHGAQQHTAMTTPAPHLLLARRVLPLHGLQQLEIKVVVLHRAALAAVAVAGEGCPPSRWLEAEIQGLAAKNVAAARRRGCGWLRAN
jgi:hypothetical protein